MSNLKNIYLIGPSRCGKTSAASIFQEKFGYTHIIMDAIIETMSDVVPDLGIRHGNLDSEEFKRFLNAYCKNLFKYTKHNIIDLEVLPLDFFKESISEDESIVIYMGYPNITPEEKMEQVRKFDTRFDWTRNLADEELLEILKRNIEISKSLQQEANNNGCSFIDTSFNREEIINQTIEQIEQSGKLYREDKSYERYYR